MKKVLIATEKPFAAAAVNGIKDIIEKAGYELRLLEKYTKRSELLAAVKDINALIIRSDQIDAEVMDAAPELKIIVRAGAGVDNVQLEEAKKRSICVMNTPGQNSNAVAELVIGLLVFAVRNFYNGKAGRELKGKTLGLHAFGHTAQNVARIAKGFDMKVIAYDPFCPSSVIEAAGVKAIENVNDLYAGADIVSLHIPATKETIKSINYDLLNQMPQGAILVNSARKEVIDEDSLIKLMDERADFCYLADVAPAAAETFKTRFDGRYFGTPKKMGAQTAEANINAGLAAARQILGFLEKNETTFQVNK
ncbi:MAG: NAD(P)-dependent oxidoreductase [Bacteroidaceae bacterium]